MKSLLARNVLVAHSISEEGKYLCKLSDFGLRSLCFLQVLNVLVNQLWNILQVRNSFLPNGSLDCFDIKSSKVCARSYFEQAIFCPIRCLGIWNSTLRGCIFTFLFSHCKSRSSLEELSLIPIFHSMKLLKKYHKDIEWTNLRISREISFLWWLYVGLRSQRIGKRFGLPFHYCRPSFKILFSKLEEIYAPLKYER